MNISKLEKILAKEPQYRIKQAKETLFKQFISDWMEAAVLPIGLRRELNQECPLFIGTKIFESQNKDTVKILLTLKDGLKVESVLMRHKDNRNTVCVSSQVGCALNCRFCATGKLGFKRNLDGFEILEQVLFFCRYLKKENRVVSNVVFMGMGEPFLNYDNVLKAIKILNDKQGFNIGARRISISTVGITEGIRRLAQENLQVNLAISLHTVDDKLRSQIMPVNKQYPLTELLKAVDYYIKKKKRKVFFEYILIDGVNDSDVDAIGLAKIMKKPFYFLNLILYNKTEAGIFEPSPFNRVKKFKEILTAKEVKFSQRYRFGENVKAACGQLAANGVE